MKARNSNSHANKGEVKSIKKGGRAVEHQVTVGDTIEKVKATCKTFGGPFVDNKFQLDGDCLNCKESRYVQDMCRISAYPEVLDLGKKAAKTSNGNGTRKIVKKEAGKKSIKDFVGDCITAGCYTRKEIISMFLANYPEHNENQGGRYVTSAFNSKYAIPRWGKIAKKMESGIVKWS